MVDANPGPSFKILAREDFSDVTYSLVIHHPLMAKAAQPGQFVIVMSHESGERIPLTIADFDREKGTVTLVVQAVGKSTKEMQQSCKVGTSLYGLVGPMGLPSPLAGKKKVVCVGGGLGVAPIYPQARGFKEHGAYVIGVLGFRTKKLIFWADKFKACCDELILCTDDGSAGIKGFVSDGIKLAIEGHADIDEVVAIGPPIMMKACAETTRPHKIKTVVSLNPLMVDGTGMCGGCRVKIGNEIKFACVDGPDFDGHKVDFNDLMLRLRRFVEEEKAALDRWSESCRMKTARPHARYRTSLIPTTELSNCPIPSRKCREVSVNQACDRVSIRAFGMACCTRIDRMAKKKKTIRSIPATANSCARAGSAGAGEEFRRGELRLFPGRSAQRGGALSAYARTRPASPAARSISTSRNLSRRSARRISAVPMTSSPQAISWRPCVAGSARRRRNVRASAWSASTLEPVAIGRLERWVGDQAIKEKWANVPYIEPSGFKVGIVGSGPAGMACAADLAKAGCEVTVYEAFHQAGGVLKYGIPDFRLPNAVVDAEIENLRKLGVKFECNTLVGRLFTIEQMRDELGFDAVFIGTGAGYPSMLGIPGDTLNGVLSANELLTRCNLMRAKEFPNYDTPLPLGKRVAVIGAGNTAMDAMRVSLRLGAEKVYCIYRRSRAECPARAEEVHHAEEEGVEFHWLTNPVEILDDGKSGVRAMRCIRMELGEPDEFRPTAPDPGAG